MAWPLCSISDSFPSALCREHHCWEAGVPGQKDHPHVERAHQLQVPARPRARPPPPHLPVRAPAPWRQRRRSVPRAHPAAFRPRRHPPGNPTGSRYLGWGHGLVFSFLRSKRSLWLHTCILFSPSCCLLPAKASSSEPHVPTPVPPVPHPGLPGHGRHGEPPDHHQRLHHVAADAPQRRGHGHGAARGHAARAVAPRALPRPQLCSRSCQHGPVQGFGSRVGGAGWVTHAGSHTCSSALS